jgi:aerobic carbon-monoxide dehydrogenase medium subunit
VSAEPAVRIPTSVEGALDALAGLGADGAPLAGGTWIMRAPLHAKPMHACYVALSSVRELAAIGIGAETATLGALATHADLAALDAGPGPLGALAEAARRSAFPAIRSVATLGGNLCATPFPEADLVPALLALDASVRVATAGGAEELPLHAYLATRGARPAGELVLGAAVPTPEGRSSWFARLTIRGGGEYAVASVAVSLDVEGGRVREARVAVGAVEDTARRVPGAEAALRGSDLDRDAVEAAGGAAAEEVASRDGVDAPGWYRRAVLPSLVREAVRGATAATGGAG